MPFPETDLRPGDIIFFKNLYKNGDGGYDYEYIDHVAIFIKYENETPMIVHSITSTKGHYYPQKISGLCITTLRALNNQIQDEDGKLYDVKYEVFRSNYPEIAAKALEIISKQAQYRIPYDEKRLSAKLKFEEDGFEGQDFAQMGVDAYRKDGIYRSIKYAARYPHPLTRTRGDGVGRGLTCSMCVTLSFQIAELLLDHKIKQIDLNTEWPSDKYASSDDARSEFFSNTYEDYQRKLRTNMQTHSSTGLRSSLFFWKGPTPPEHYQHRTFAIDAKVTGAEGMYYYMRHLNQEAWEYLGEVHVNKRFFSPEDKALHKQKLLTSHRDFLNQIAATVRQSPLLCSASGSEAPVTDELRENWWKISTEIEENIMNKTDQTKIKITQDDLNIFLQKSTKMAAARVFEACISPHSLADLMTISIFLLDREDIRCAMLPYRQVNELPSFTITSNGLHYLNRIFLLGKSMEPNPTFYFYPSDPTNQSRMVYYLFVQDFFNNLMSLCAQKSDEEKSSLINELSQRGKKLLKKNFYLQASAVFLAEQIVYCLFTSPSDNMRNEMLWSCLYRNTALTRIETIPSFFSETELKKARNILITYIEHCPEDQFQALSENKIVQELVKKGMKPIQPKGSLPESSMNLYGMR